MKTSHCYGVVLLFSIMCHNAQSQQTDTLDINNIKATFSFNGSWFTNHNNNDAAFEAPKGSGHTSIYGSGVWIAGKDSSGKVHTSAIMYETDFHGIDNFRRVWKVEKSDIDYHINNYSSPGYSVPSSITDWPAHGDVSTGQNYFMAPFEDVDQNGYYTPGGGDYPLIKGDQAIWWILYDDSTHHYDSDSLNIQIECMAYAYNCVDSALSNTIFVDIKIKNRSAVTYTDMYISNWVDFDIGCGENDYVACDVQNGFFYGYNGTEYDTSCNGALGYGVTPVVGAMIFGANQNAYGIDNPGPSVSNSYYVPVDTAINQNGIPYRALGSYYGDGYADNERLGLNTFIALDRLGPSWGNDPNNAVEFYEYMSGEPSGNGFNPYSPWIHGGSPHYSDSTADTLLTKYYYPGNSDPLYWSTAGDTTSYWSAELFQGQPIPVGDKRGVGSSGPFTMAPGEIEEVTFAYVFAMDNNDTTIFGAMDELEARCEYIKGFVDQGLSCGQPVGIDEETQTVKSFNLFPNPANGIVTLEFNKQPELILIHDLSGKLITRVYAPQRTTLIDITGYASGIYLITVQSGNQIMRKKLVKQ